MNNKEKKEKINTNSNKKDEIIDAGWNVSNG